jgi:hypothetical protein
MQGVDLALAQCHDLHADERRKAAEGGDMLLIAREPINRPPRCTTAPSCGCSPAPMRSAARPGPADALAQPGQTDRRRHLVRLPHPVSPTDQPSAARVHRHRVHQDLPRSGRGPLPRVAASPVAHVARQHDPPGRTRRPWLASCHPCRLWPRPVRR